MSSTIAGELNQMDSLSKDFDTAAGQVTDLMSKLDSITTTTIGTGWKGNSAQKFLGQWTEEFKPALVRLNEALAAASAEVNRRKTALVQADS